MPNERFVVLAIDDDDNVRELVVDALRFDAADYGVSFEPYSASDLDEAAKLVRERGIVPDLFIIDVDFSLVGGGEKDGVEEILPVIKALTSNNVSFARSKIVIYSGQFSDEETEVLARRAIRGGASAFWAKEDVTNVRTLIPKILPILRESASDEGDLG